ncbi:MAG: adenine phosphoribosyltransferase [Bacteroidales bacterium]|nr:adenine phosphoribosyltransferase [Bacteroidales bacterium]MBP5316433.1 adenine phosphoribosyltransferase [Bacteroidales bacterium]
MDKKLLVDNIRKVPDYPVKGIMFFDVTTLFKNHRCLMEIVDSICEMYRDKGITKVAGVESRGFVVGAAVAAKLGAGFVPVRKPGKLPAEIVSESYSKEYGTDVIEMHTDAIEPGDVVLVHDDILATGGTASAAVRLVKKFNPKAVYANFIIDIVDIPRSRPIPSDVEVSSLLQLSEK